MPTATAPAPDTLLTRRTILARDGFPLAHFRLGDGTGRVAFLTHSQAQHSLNILPTAQGLVTRGWTVHMTDLRGHGDSCGTNAPFAHMEMGRGWDRLVEDLRAALEVAFDGVAWEDRLVIGPNIGALLVLEVLKDWPDLARQIVLTAPPPNQPALSRMARGVTRVRSMVHSPDQPDELLLHHLFSYLGAQIDGCERLVDVVSSDREITDALLTDPRAWPVPTTGYFHEMFRGMEQAWQWPPARQVRADTRMMVLYGDEDPMTARGQFIAPMRKHFATMGIQDVTAQCVQGGRCGLVIDESRLRISERIARWCNGLAPDDAPHGAPHATQPATMAHVSGDVLARLGMENYDDVLSPDKLVELCYTAVDDDSRYVEILYRLTYALSQDTNLSEQQLDNVLTALMPHWDRSYRLNRQIMQSAAVGAVLENVVERFRIGIAIVDDDFRISYANGSFVAALESLSGTPCHAQARSGLTQAVAPLLSRAFTDSVKGGAAETLLVVNDVAVGLHMRPRALMQTALTRGGASGVLILRDPEPATRDLTDRQATEELLQFAYGMTAKEAATALCLLEGLSPGDISDRLSVSIHTTRTHLKRVYEKVDVANKTELVSRLLKGPLGLVAGHA